MRFVLFFNLAMVVALGAQAKTLSFTEFRGEMGMGHLMAWMYFESHLDRCLVDTGARSTTVRGSKFLPEAPVLGQVPTGGLSGVSTLADVIQVKEIKAWSGDWLRKDVQIRRVNEVKALPVNCIVGNDFFMGEKLSFDFKNQTISSEAVFAGKEFELQHYNGLWSGFPVQAGAQSMDSLFDTGAALTVVDPSIIEVDPANFEFVQKMDVTEGSNAQVPGAIYKMKSLKFGDVEVRDSYVISTSLARLQQEIPSVKMVLGYNVIGNYHWYIDNITLKWGLF